MDVNAIMKKVEEGDIQAVQQFIRNNPDKVNLKNRYGKTFLMAACVRGNIDLVDLLIKAKSELDMCDNHNQTALHYAVINHQIDAVVSLLSGGANVNKQNSWGNTPLHRAVAKKYKDVVEVLLSSKGHNTLQVSQGNKFGWTPLHVAAFNGNTEVVELLLQQTGVDTSKGDIKGSTPLHYAALFGHREVVELLQQTGIDTSKPNQDGDTPLHLAVREQQYDVVASMLAQASVKLDVENHKKMTPLLEAISGSHLGIIHKLITHGANINAVDNDGNNCLHHAVRKEMFHSEEEHIPILDESCTELQLPISKRLSGIVVAGYLASYGANLHSCNKQKNTPLDFIKVQHLKEKLQTFLLSLCRLCEEKNASITLHPCQHQVCQNCCSKMTFKKCPECRKPILNKSGFESRKFADKDTQTVAEPTDSSTQKRLYRVANNLAGKWRQVGIELGIKGVDLDIIEEDNYHSVVERSYQMLLKWYRSCDPQKRTLRILKALEVNDCHDAVECLLPEFN